MGLKGNLYIVMMTYLKISPRSPMCDHDFLASSIKGQAFTADKDPINGSHCMW